MQATLTTIGALWRREILKFVRDRSRLVGALLQPLGFWVLLGLGFRGTFRMPVETAADVGYMEFLFPGIIALILLFTAIFSTIYVVEDRKAGFMQAALVAPGSRVALVLGNVLGGATLALAEAALFLFLMPTIGLTPSLPGLLLIFLVCFLTHAFLERFPGLDRLRGVAGNGISYGLRVFVASARPRRRRRSEHRRSRH